MKLSKKKQKKSRKSQKQNRNEIRNSSSSTSCESTPGSTSSAGQEIHEETYHHFLEDSWDEPGTVVDIPSSQDYRPTAFLAKQAETALELFIPRIAIHFLDPQKHEPAKVREFYESFKYAHNYLHRFYLRLKRTSFNYTEHVGRFQTLRSQIWEHACDIYRHSSEASHCRSGDSIIRVRLSDQIFLLITKVNMCILEDLPNPSQLQIPYVCKNKLVMTRTSIFNMNLKEVIDSVIKLSRQWDKLEYSPVLREYVYLLEKKVSSICVESHPASVHNIEEFRKLIPNSEPELYTPTEGLISKFCAYFSNFHLRLLTLLICERVECPQKFLAKPEQVQRLTDWLYHTSEQNYGDAIYTDYRTEYIINLIPPGEREEFIRCQPAEVLTDTHIHKFTYGGEINQKMMHDAGSRQGSEILKDDPHECPDSLPVFASILLRSAFKGMFGLSFSAHVIYKFEVLDRRLEFQREKGPIIVQLFNYYDVYYDGRIFILEDFLKAVVVFFNILKIDNHLKIPNDGRSIEKLYVNIFGNADSDNKGIDDHIENEKFAIKPYEDLSEDECAC